MCPKNSATAGSASSTNGTNSARNRDHRSPVGAINWPSSRISTQNIEPWGGAADQPTITSRSKLRYKRKVAKLPTALRGRLATAQTRPLGSQLAIAEALPVLPVRAAVSSLRTDLTACRPPWNDITLGLGLFLSPGWGGSNRPFLCRVREAAHLCRECRPLQRRFTAVGRTIVAADDARLAENSPPSPRDTRD